MSKTEISTVKSVKELHRVQKRHIYTSTENEEYKVHLLPKFISPGSTPGLKTPRKKNSEINMLKVKGRWAVGTFKRYFAALLQTSHSVGIKVVT